MKSIVCEQDGKKINYSAAAILEIKFDSIIYESGLVKIKKSKQYVFLRRTIKGELSLYETQVRNKEIIWKNIGEDFIHLRWVYRAQKWARKNRETIYFYKKEYEPREDFSKSWKEKVTDCKVISDKVKSKTTVWTPTPEELVEFYNSNCR